MSRTTLTIDPDVAAALAKRRRERGTTLKAEVNGLLRAGLEMTAGSLPPAERFETRPLPLGKAHLASFDDVAEVLDLGEGEGHA